MHLCSRCKLSIFLKGFGNINIKINSKETIILISYSIYVQY